MHLIAGLGNPGNQYLFSRHNLGFMLVDRLADDHNIRTARSQYNCLYGDGLIDGSRVILAKPQTFMNLSGSAITALFRFLKLEPENLIVLHDDLDLPYNTVRMKKGGGAGGHKGLLSIMENLGSPDFIRVRLGIGKPVMKEMTDGYVLARFSPDEMEILPEFLARGADAVESILESGLQKTMNLFNLRPASVTEEEDP